MTLEKFLESYLSHIELFHNESYDDEQALVVAALFEESGDPNKEKIVETGGGKTVEEAIADLRHNFEGKDNDG